MAARRRGGKSLAQARNASGTRRRAVASWTPAIPTPEAAAHDPRNHSRSGQGARPSRDAGARPGARRRDRLDARHDQPHPGRLRGRARAVPSRARGAGPAMTSDLLNQDATDLAAAIRARKVSSPEVTEAGLTAAARLQPALNCFIRIDRDQALAAAGAIDAALANGAIRGPLAGVPLAHKDMYYRAGEVTTCGSKIKGDFKPPVTATAL